MPIKAGGSLPKKKPIDVFAPNLGPGSTFAVPAMFSQTYQIGEPPTKYFRKMTAAEQQELLDIVRFQGMHMRPDLEGSFTIPITGQTLDIP